jgi:zinc and cadmium transporter
MGIEVWLSVLVIMLVSLSGALFVNRLTKDFFEQRLPFLVSFSAGVFLVSAGALALEVFDLVSSVWIGVLMITLGYLLAWLLNRLLPETHHHHDSECLRPKSGAKKLIIGDGIHNIADGIVLITAFSTSSVLGFAIAVSIIVHETLQGISEFFVLRQAGYATKQALLINFSVSSTIIIGVLLGYFALASDNLESILLAISAGFFLQVVIHDLLPKHSHHETKVDFSKHILLVIIGAILMGLIATSLTEDHGHEESSIIN